MKKKICIQGAVVALMTALMTVPALAAPTGDVSGDMAECGNSDQDSGQQCGISCSGYDSGGTAVCQNRQCLHGLPKAWTDGVGAHCDPFRGTYLFSDCPDLYLDYPRYLT